MSNENPATEDDVGVKVEAPVSKRLARNFKDGRTRTMIVVLVGVVITSGLLFGWLLGGDDENPDVVTTAAPRAPAPNVVATGGKLTEERRAQMQAEDAERAERALQEGRSSAVRPLAETYDFGSMGIPEQTVPPEPAPAPTAVPAPTPPPQLSEAQRAELTAYQQAQLARANAKRVEMSNLLSSINQSQPGTYTAWTQPEDASTIAGAAGEGAIVSDRNSSLIPTVVLSQAGDTAYAYMEDTADSDLNAPIFVKIVDGPLKGAKMKGSFQPDQGFRCLVIRFDLLAVPGQESVPVDALAFNPEDGTACMISERNGRYLSRFGGIVLVGTLAGLGEAASTEGGTTTVTPGGVTVVQQPESSSERTGKIIAGNIAEEAQDAVRELLRVNPQVKFNRNAPLGIRMLSDILAEPSEINNAISADVAIK